MVKRSWTKFFFDINPNLLVHSEKGEKDYFLLMIQIQNEYEQPPMNIELDSLTSWLTKTYTSYNRWTKGKGFIFIYWKLDILEFVSRR